MLTCDNSRSSSGEAELEEKRRIAPSLDPQFTPNSVGIVKELGYTDETVEVVAKWQAEGHHPVGKPAEYYVYHAFYHDIHFVFGRDSSALEQPEACETICNFTFNQL